MYEGRSVIDELEMFIRAQEHTILGNACLNFYGLRVLIKSGLC